MNNDIMLVKLVSDVKKECLKEYEECKYKWTRVKENYKIVNCSQCKAFSISDKLGVDCEYISLCRSCFKSFCENCSYEENSNFCLCFKCYKILNNEESFKKCSIKDCICVETDNFIFGLRLINCKKCKRIFCDDHLEEGNCLKCENI